MHARKWRYNNSSQKRKFRELSPDYRRRSKSPPGRLERSSSPYSYSGRSHFPRHNVERSNSPSHSRQKSECTFPNYFERGKSPAYCLEKSKSPVHYPERSMSPFHYSEKSISPAYHLERTKSPPNFVEGSKERSISQAHYLERSRSPIYYPEGNKSPAYCVERSRSPMYYPENQSSAYCVEKSRSPMYYPENQSSACCMERSRSPIYYPEGNKSSAYCLERSRSPIYYPEGTKSSAYCLERSRSPVYYPETSKSPAYCLQRSNSPIYSLERNKSPVYYPEKNNFPSHYSRNMESSFSSLRKSKSQSPPLELKCETSDGIDKTSSARYFQPYKPDRHKCDEQQCHESNEDNYATTWSTSGEVNCSTQLTNTKPNTDIRDFSPTFPNTPHSSRTNYLPKKNGLSPKTQQPKSVKNIFNDGIKTLEDIENMSKTEIRSQYMSGASHRKVKKLMAQGVSNVQARFTVIKENFMKQLNQVKNVSSSNESRKIINGNSSEVDQGISRNSEKISTVQLSCSKIPSSEQKTSRYSETTKPRIEDRFERVAVVHHGYPQAMMGYDKLKLIQAAILSAYDKLTTNGPQVRFVKCKCKDKGFLLVTCADKTSADWLREIVPQLTPWKGAILKTLADEERVPKPVKCFVYVPDENGERLSKEVIVHRLKVANKGLNSHLWMAVEKTPREQGQLWSFAMDLDSLQLLKKLNMTPYFGFGSLKFSLDEHSPDFTF